MKNRFHPLLQVHSRYRLRNPIIHSGHTKNP
jgi:hypothetical protein